MKSIFCYTLPLALATSSLIAGPKPEPKKPNPQESPEQQREGSRRPCDTPSAAWSSDNASALQAHDPSATASIAETKPNDDLFELDATQNSSQNGAMESIHSSKPLGHLIIDDYFSAPSSPESKSADGRMALVPPSATRDLDQQRLLVEKLYAHADDAAALHQQEASRIRQNSVFDSLSQTLGRTPPSSKKLIATQAAVQETYEDLSTIAIQFGADSPDQLFSKITEDPQKIIFFDQDHKMREKAPIAQSCEFGIVIRQELEQLQQKTIAANINKLKNLQPPEALKLIEGDLGRVGESATYLFKEGATTISLTARDAENNLELLRNFIGDEAPDIKPIEVAIASVMQQAGQSDFEAIKLGAPRDGTDKHSLPFFTKGVNNSLWRPYLSGSEMGPIFTKLFSAEGRTETQSYILEKSKSTSGASSFQLTAISLQSAEQPDFKYTISRHVTYQFEENLLFNPSHPISEENSPVTIKCLDGKIVQSFEDKRTPEKFNHQAAQYNLAVYQERLEALGDPAQIEAEHQNRIQFLAGRAASRSGSIMTQDRNAAEAKLQQLRKAQQDVARAQQAMSISKKRLNGAHDDETDSEPGFDDDLYNN